MNGNLFFLKFTPKNNKMTLMVRFHFDVTTTLGSP